LLLKAAEPRFLRKKKKKQFPVFLRAFFKFSFRSEASFRSKASFERKKKLEKKKLGKNRKIRKKRNGFSFQS
jgi:hypothetical protein